MAKTNEELYQNYNSAIVLPQKIEENWSRAYFKRYLLPHLPPQMNTSLLEIGCGYGRYLKFLEEEGYKNCCGLDISAEQIEYGKHQLGLSNIFQKDPLEYFAESKKKYDVIMLIDILEHLNLQYTVTLLKRAKEALSEEGFLIIQVPNAISPFALTFHGDITHERSFSIQSLEQLLRMAAFDRMKHFALPPLIHGIKSFVRRILWSGIISPLIAFILLISSGSKMGGIYTSNFLTLAYK